MHGETTGRGRPLDDLASARQGLARRIDRWVRELGHPVSAVPGLWLHRVATITEPSNYVLGPNICLVAQGTKRVLLGDEVYVYDADHFLVTSVGLPVTVEVVEADSQRPYLGLRMELDQGLISRMMVDSDLPRPRADRSGRGIAVSGVTLPLLTAFQRLVDLLDEPEDIPMLAPLIKQEIVYRLLVGEQGPRLRRMAVAGSRSRQIAQALEWLQTNYARPLRIDDLAGRTGMSASTFHHHFRSMTAMTPLQYQKMLRLQEARRLLLTGSLDAATVAFHVGYESPSQFSREYSRLFGAPPMRDVRRLNRTVRDGA